MHRRVLLKFKVAGFFFLIVAQAMVWDINFPSMLNMESGVNKNELKF